MTVTEPARSPRRRRVPRNTLNPDRILDAAVSLLDRDGPEAFTMRALANELGVGTMAVYSHFRNKDEINDAVNERLLSEIELPAPAGSTPREQISELCRSVYRLFSEHPAALPLLTSRPMRVDEAIAVIDRQLGLLLAAGLSPADAARAQTAIMHYTVGAALWAVRRRQAESGECEGHGVREKFRERLSDLPPDRYPSLRGLVPELLAAQDTGIAQFEHGLNGLLSGLLPA
ncbi:TetR/AcrR family transcriptional regulator [Streptomyces sp. NPDC059373]